MSRSRYIGDLCLISVLKAPKSTILITSRCITEARKRPKYTPRSTEYHPLRRSQTRHHSFPPLLNHSPAHESGPLITPATSPRNLYLFATTTITYAYVHDRPSMDLLPHPLRHIEYRNHMDHLLASRRNSDRLPRHSVGYDIMGTLCDYRTGDSCMGTSRGQYGGESKGGYNNYT